MRNYITQRLQEAENVRLAILNDSKTLQDIEDITKVLWQTIEKGSSIYFCGNGGSAADAQHLATELSGRFLKDRQAIKAEALGTNMAFITAISNDYSFDNIYARSLEALGREGDALVLLSTSGNSQNVLKAAKKAKEMGILTIAFTGANGDSLIELCDFSFMVPSKSVPRIQEAHLVIGHILCEHLEDSLITLKPGM